MIMQEALCPSSTIFAKSKNSLNNKSAKWHCGRQTTICNK